MHFFIDMDGGSFISGWLVPDNPSDVPEFIVRVPGRPDVAMSANVLRTDLRDLGMHASGLAGFNVDSQHVSDIAELEDVTLLEAHSGIPIYRRPGSHAHLATRFLLTDTSAFPQIQILRRMIGFFALAYPVVDRLPVETISSIVANKEATSVFVSGQPNWVRHGSNFREREYFTAALLRDPFEDLAERLVFISHLVKQPQRGGPNTSLNKYGPALDAVKEMDFNDRKSVLASFRKMSPEAKRLFRAPMTFVYGGSPESDLQRRNVSVALDNLAQFDVVGVRPLFSEFASMVNEGLGVDAVNDVDLATLPGTFELATLLADIGLVADLLDEDIALYSFACEAVEAGLNSTRIPNESAGMPNPLGGGLSE